GQVVVPRLTEAALQSLARAGNGRYARSTVDDRDLAQVLGDANPGWFSVKDMHGLTSDRWREEGPWLLLLLLPIAGLVFRRGLLVLAMIFLLPLPDPAAALDWREPWHNDNQRGAQSFHAQDYERAVAAFRDPEWQAAALYRAGQFEQAATVLAPLRHPEALYNRGNALARLGRFEEAMGLYERVLRAEPGHADARHNLELLRDIESPTPPPTGGSDGNSESARRSPGESDGASSTNRRDEGTLPPREGDQQREGGADDSSQATGSPTPTSDSQTPKPAPQQANADAEEVTSEPAATEVPPGSPTENASEPEDESQQAMQQWLRRIKDDPGGLLRRKFKYQYSRRPRGEAAETEPW
ncbi:MAG: tetratricopeptide repeat protein, partial [Gammaproteobacteria bacterium]|nr:tetratricopeptide repeat protein [Gammaproteobacteria bacterium]